MLSSVDSIYYDNVHVEPYITSCSMLSYVDIFLFGLYWIDFDDIQNL